MLQGSPVDAGYLGVLGVLSFHRNGFVRHQAVRQLAEITGRQRIAIPYHPSE